MKIFFEDFYYVKILFEGVESVCPRWNGWDSTGADSNNEKGISKATSNYRKPSAVLSCKSTPQSPRCPLFFTSECSACLFIHFTSISKCAAVTFEFENEKHK